MFNSSLVELLKTLSSNEISDFGVYIRSPYFNRNRNVISLFSYLKKYHPSYSNKNLVKENVFMKIFNTNKYNKGLMATTMFHLSGHIENWMAYKNFSENSYKRNEFLLKEFESRNLSRFYEKVYEKMKSEIEGRKIDSEYVNEKLWLNAFFSNYISSRTLEGQRGLDQVYKEMGELLLVNFLIWARNIVQNFEIREQFYKMKTDINLLKSYFGSIDMNVFFKKIKHYPGKYSALIEFISYQILCILDASNENYYYKCKQLLDKVRPLLGYNELFTAHSNLLHSAHRKENINYEKYSVEYYSLLKSMIETNVHKGYGAYMSVNTFDAVLNTSLNHKDIAWAEKFVSKYIKELPLDIRKNILYYSQARIEAEKGNFDEAFRFYNKINIEGFMLKIRLRMFLIKIYYDIEQYDTVLSHIDTFRHFLSNRENISESGRILYLEFLKVLNMLVSYKMKKKAYIIDKIKRSLGESENIINKNWLYEKLKEISV